MHKMKGRWVMVMVMTDQDDDFIATPFLTRPYVHTTNLAVKTPVDVLIYLLTPPSDHTF